MYKEMTGMTNEEMFTAVISRMDSMNSRMEAMESGLNGRMDSMESRMNSMESRMEAMESGLNDRMDSMEGHMEAMEGHMEAMETRLNDRIDNLESNMDMEFKAVRTEMNVVYKTLKKDISILDDKIDRIMYTKDVDGHERMKIQVELLAKGYQELKEKIG